MQPAKTVTVYLSMPRYYFRVSDPDRRSTEPIEEELPNDEIAISIGRLVALEILRDATLENRTAQEIVEVINKDGLILARFNCSRIEGLAEEEHEGGSGVPTRH